MISFHPASGVSNFFLVRHGETNWVGRGIAGRLPSVPLNPRGKRQAEDLAARLQGVPWDLLLSSPLQRAQETAAPLGNLRGERAALAAAFNELDWGDWTGMSFHELDSVPEWASFNAGRCHAAPPGGETMAAVAHRALTALRMLHRDGAGNVAIFTHADVIKAVVLAAHGAPFQAMHGFSVDPASVTLLQWHEHGTKLLLLNDGYSRFQCCRAGKSNCFADRAGRRLNESYKHTQ